MHARRTSLVLILCLCQGTQCHLHKTQAHRRHRSGARRSEQLLSHSREHRHGRLSLAEMPEGGHERHLATWEQDLVRDDDDEMLQEEIDRDRAPSTSHQAVALGQSVSQSHSAQHQKRIQTLMDQAQGAEQAVEGAQRAEARAISRLHNIQQQVTDLKNAYSVESADAARLLLKSQTQANQTAAAFQTAERLELSLEQTKRKYHLSNTAAKQFAMDLHERQNDEVEQSRLVDEIHREVSNLITHSHHVQSDLANTTAENEVLESSQKSNGAGEVHFPSSGTSTEQVAAAQSSKNYLHGSTQKSISGLMSRSSAEPQGAKVHSNANSNNVKAISANHFKATIDASRLSQHAQALVKPASPPRVRSSLGQRSHLISFGETNPVIAKSGRNQRPASKHAVTQIQKAKGVSTGEEEYRGTYIEDTLSLAMAKTLGFVRSAWTLFCS